MRVYKTLKGYSNYNTSKPSNVLTEENRKYIKYLKSLTNKKHGSGLLNSMLKNLPLPEMHLSLPNKVQCEKVDNGSFNNTGKYSYCGPGTKVQKRLQEGYEGVNSLDKACKDHDIYYSKYKSTKDRNKADDILANIASKIALDENEPEYEREHAKIVTAIMAAKSKFGMGSSKNVMGSLCN